MYTPHNRKPEEIAECGWQNTEAEYCSICGNSDFFAIWGTEKRQRECDECGSLYEDDVNVPIGMKCTSCETIDPNIVTAPCQTFWYITHERKQRNEKMSEHLRNIEKGIIHGTH